MHVDAERLPGLRAQFGDDLTISRSIDGIHYEVEIRSASAEILANELAGWGDDIEILRPDEVRRRLLRIGTELVHRYGGPARELVAPKARRRRR